MHKLLKAQDLLGASASGQERGGFNMFIMGDERPNPQVFRGGSFEGYNSGYSLAEEMATEGKIFYTHNFPCSCGGILFLYGGKTVCNDCGGNSQREDWHVIRVEKDGDQYCCYGQEFINLQESDNYAFGATREGAIEAYRVLNVY